MVKKNLTQRLAPYAVAGALATGATSAQAIPMVNATIDKNANEIVYTVDNFAPGQVPIQGVFSPLGIPALDVDYSTNSGAGFYIDNSAYPGVPLWNNSVGNQESIMEAIVKYANSVDESLIPLSGTASIFALNGDGPCSASQWCIPYTIEDITKPGQVPEPTTIALLGLGLAGIGYSRKKLNSKNN
ncbi:MAG: PEP-CTERM sorting domain-containing protein [Nanoarchaeota archaeon]|nr:PEP-CTERM sorting domain-containing protein [Nanoarchaeota archaeon]